MSLFHLTHGLSREGPERDFVSAAARTHVGQAHLAGSGPFGKTCRECLSWQFVKAWAAKGGPKPSPCAQYRRLMREWGRNVPHDAAACKYFEPRGALISLLKPERAQ